MKANNDFTRKMFLRMLTPCLISSVGLALADIADAVVVGNRMGAVGLAAIGMTLPVYMILNTFMHGFGIGGAVNFSMLLGEGKKEEANNSFNSVLRTSLLLSVIIAAVFNAVPQLFLFLLGTTPKDGELYTGTLNYVRLIAGGAPLFFLAYILGYYLRNDGNEKLAATAFTIGNLTDLALNIVFVLVLDWGTVGAGVATLIGLTVTNILYLPGLIGRKKGLIELRFGKSPLEMRKAFSQWLSGFSTSCQYLCQMVFIIISNNVLIRSEIGENGVAVFDMIQNASYLIFYLYEGTNKALQPLVSTFWGEKNYREVEKARKLSKRYGLIAGGLMAVLLSVFSPQVCTLFGVADQVEIGVPALVLFCISSAFAGYCMMTECYYQSIDNSVYPLVIVLLRGTVVLIPMTLLLGLTLPQYFLYLLFLVTEITSVAVFLLFRAVRPVKAYEINPERIFTTTITDAASDAGDLSEKIGEFCERWEALPKQQYFVAMSAEEICLAIIQNGFAEMKEKGQPGAIQVTMIALEDGDFELHIRDNAVSFDPFALQTSKAGEADFDVDAMGMMVIKNKAKEFFYRRYGGFNSLVLKI